MIVEAKGIYKTYGKKHVIKNINFSIKRNEIVALVGPNGAGKTTLFNVMATLHQADKGDIYIDGQHIHKQRSGVLKNMFFMQDASTLYADLTGKEHLIFLSKIRKRPMTDVQQVIQETGIDGYVDQKVKTYSTGMKQHLLLAMAILSNPALLIMDEPANGLDPTGAELFREKILKMRGKGTTILFSSHILSDIDKIADRILFIREGEIVNEQSLVQENSPVTTYILTVKQLNQAMDILRHDGEVGEVKKAGQNKIHVTLLQGHFGRLIGQLHKNNIEVIDVEKMKSGAEKMYNEIYGEQT